MQAHSLEEGLDKFLEILDVRRCSEIFLVTFNDRLQLITVRSLRQLRFTYTHSIVAPHNADTTNLI